jgi:hypothetical protein
MGINPGNLAYGMPPAADDQVRKQRDLERQARENASARGLAASQIGSGGLLVTDGGSITIEGTGSLNVGAGALNSAGAISAGTTIAAGTDIAAGGKVTATGEVKGGTVTSTGDVAAAGTVSGATMSATGNVSAGGQVYSQAPLRSPGSHDYLVTTDYVAGWINSDGTVGTSPSNRGSKKNLVRMDATETPMGVDAAVALMGLTPYWGHYLWDDDGSPLKVFLIAEDVSEAGFGPDVAPVRDDGQAYTVNYSQLVVPLLAAIQKLTKRVQELEAKA